MLKNIKINQIGPHRKNCLNITAALDLRPAANVPWVKSLLAVSVLVMYPGNPAWATTGGLFIPASYSEITGGILLMGLSLAALMFGLRLVLQSAKVSPPR